jgi:hypothetical protein
MTRRKRWTWILALLFCGLSGGILGYVALPRSQITRANAAKVEAGMDLATVEAIMGGPARDESTGLLEQDYDATDDAVAHLLFEVRMQADLFPRLLMWRSDRALLQVVLDDADRVVACDALSLRRAPEGPLKKLRRWLGL